MRRARSRARTWVLTTTTALLCVATAANALQPGFPDWHALADVDVIHVITHDEDGDTRETPVWLVVLDGQPYLRTDGSRWLANIERGSAVHVRVEGLEFRVGAERATGSDLVERVDAATLEKYGWQERVISLFTTGAPDLLRLVPHEGEAGGAR